jgi:hypothetical protein
MLNEAAGFRTRGSGRRRAVAAAAGLAPVLLLVWFLSQHLSFTTQANPVAPTPHPAPAGGFPRTEAGAVDAATFYVTTINGPLLLEPDRLTQFDKRAGSVGYAEQLVKDSLEGAATMESTFGLRAAQQQGLAVVLQPQPVAYKVATEWNRWSVSVALWWIELLDIDGVTPTIALWQTTTLGLVWENGAWHISSAQTEAGPGPDGDNLQLPDQLRSFKPYRHVV